MKRFGAVLRLRCPHCCRGPLFKGVWQMYERCPVCGVLYEREQGYFMTAIFVGYVLGFLVLLPLNAALFILDVPPIYFLIGNLLVLTALSPLIFRYSRAIWMHVDEILDPRQEPDEAQPAD